MSLPFWFLPLMGGLMIGAAASLLLLLHGRIAGISHIVGGLWSAAAGDRAWRGWFIAGLLAGGVTLAVFQPEAFGHPVASWLQLTIAGWLVGFGASLGNGCTSGHGVCGLSRRSLRSLLATLVFIGSGMATVYLTQHVLGKASL
jgi:uncharacterized membrane protein YedE/YeeE